MNMGNHLISTFVSPLDEMKAILVFLTEVLVLENHLVFVVSLELGEVVHIKLN